jgi:nitrate reductase beta subunit
MPNDRSARRVKHGSVNKRFRGRYVLREGGKIPRERQHIEGIVLVFHNQNQFEIKDYP